VQIGPLPVFLLAAADDELVLLDRDVQLVAGEARHGERDPQPIRLALGAGEALDVVGRITVASGAGDAVERTLDGFEAEQERRIQCRRTRHIGSPSGASVTPRPSGARRSTMIWLSFPLVQEA